MQQKRNNENNNRRLSNSSIKYNNNTSNNKKFTFKHDSLNYVNLGISTDLQDKNKPVDKVTLKSTDLNKYNESAYLPKQNQINISTNHIIKNKLVNNKRNHSCTFLSTTKYDDNISSSNDSFPLQSQDKLIKSKYSSNISNNIINQQHQQNQNKINPAKEEVYQSNSLKIHDDLLYFDFVDVVDLLYY